MITPNVEFSPNNLYGPAERVPGVRDPSIRVGRAWTVAMVELSARGGKEGGPII